MTRALVLGGGGVAGIAWETGLLIGLTDEGVDVLDAGLLVGTSAGSAVAAQVTSGASLDELFARQFTPPEQSGELAAQLDVDKLARLFVRAMREATTAEGRRAAIGRAALEAETVPESARRAVIEHRLPKHEWPTGRDVRIVAADAESGALRVFTAADGVSIVDAVAASCAVPGIWPPVTIDGRRYIDGGMRSVTNADIAGGCDAVLVLAPVVDAPGIADPDAIAAIEKAAAAARWLTITPDAAAAAAIGVNPLDLATRAPAATAGRKQGRAIAKSVKAIWD